MRNTPMPISSADELVTSAAETRAGFIEFALEKNRRSEPYIEAAKAFRHFASTASRPEDLLHIAEIRDSLVTASGISDKARKYFSDEEKAAAVGELIEKFLKPAGAGFIEDVVYRYLLMRGDTLGGRMRNVAGALAQQKFIRQLLSVLNVHGVYYHWLSADKKAKWEPKPPDDYGVENTLRAIAWQSAKGNRTLVFNLTIPIIGNNIDLCLFACNHKEYSDGGIANNIDAPIMLGELKWGIDPAGADEHWKTARTALTRIRSAFSGRVPAIATSFVGAAIESKMAEEIYDQLQANELTNAANLTKEGQMLDYCQWMFKL
jgi:type II restriction enzyme